MRLAVGGGTAFINYHSGDEAAEEAVAWLSSPEAKMINGQILFIGGRLYV